MPLVKADIEENSKHHRSAPCREGLEVRYTENEFVDLIAF